MHRSRRREDKSHRYREGREASTTTTVALARSTPGPPFVYFFEGQEATAFTALERARATIQADPVAPNKRKRRHSCAPAATLRVQGHGGDRPSRTSAALGGLHGALSYHGNEGPPGTVLVSAQRSIRAMERLRGEEGKGRETGSYSNDPFINILVSFKLLVPRYAGMNVQRCSLSAYRR